MKLLSKHISTHTHNNITLIHSIIFFLYRKKSRRERRREGEKHDSSFVSTLEEAIFSEIKKILKSRNKKRAFGFPKFFEFFFEAVKLEVESFKFNTEKEKMNELTFKRVSANLRNTVALDFLNHYLEVTNVILSKNISDIDKANILVITGKIVPHYASIYGMQKLDDNVTEMLNELMKHSLELLPRKTPESEELLAGILKVDNFIVEGSIPQVIQTIFASGANAGIFMTKFVQVYGELRQIDTNFLSLLLEAFASMIREHKADENPEVEMDLFTPETAIRISENVYMRLVPAQVKAVLEQLLAFYKEHFADVSDVHVTVLREFCKLFIAVISGINTANATALTTVFEEIIETVIGAFEKMGERFDWASETVILLANAMSVCWNPGMVKLGVKEFRRRIVKPFFMMCSDDPASDYEKMKIQYSKLELGLAYLGFYGDSIHSSESKKMASQLIKDFLELNAVNPEHNTREYTILMYYWQLVLQNISTLCTYAEEDTVMMLMENLFRTAGSASHDETANKANIPELALSVLCDSSLYTIPFFRYKGVESTLSVMLNIPAVKAELDLMGATPLEELTWKRMTKIVGDFQTASEGTMDQNDSASLRRFLSLLLVYPTMFFRGAEEKTLFYMILILAVVTRTAKDEWLRKVLVNSVVKVIERIVTMISTKKPLAEEEEKEEGEGKERKDDGGMEVEGEGKEEEAAKRRKRKEHSGCEIIAKRMPKKLVSFLLRENCTKVFNTYIQCVFTSGAVDNIAEYIEELSESAHEGEGVLALCVHCADIINSKLYTAKRFRSGGATEEVTEAEMARYMNFARHCITKLLVVDDGAAADKSVTIMKYILSTKMLKFNEIFDMFYRRGQDDASDAMFHELFTKQVTMFLRGLAKLVLGIGKSKSFVKFSRAILDYVEGLISSICVRKKLIPTPLYTRLVALIHFVSVHLVAPQHNPEAELNTIRFAYGKLVTKGDRDQSAMMLRFIREELASQNSAHVKIATVFLDVYIRRIGYLEKDVISSVLHAISTYTSEAPTDEVLGAIKSFNTICRVMNEKMYIEKVNDKNKLITEHNDKLKKGGKKKDDETGFMSLIEIEPINGPAGTAIVENAFSCLDVVARRDDINSEVFCEIAKFINFLIPFITRMMPLIQSVMNGMIVRMFAFYTKGKDMKEAVICAGSLSRLFNDFSNRTNR